ncbi:MAG: tetratricopeptide repeat protein [Planctomycetota bacterium]
MAIQLFCTNCGNPLIVPTKLAGRRLGCGSCQEVNVVPDLSDVEQVPDDQIGRSGRYELIEGDAPGGSGKKAKKKGKKPKDQKPTRCTTCGAMVPAGDPICCACGTEVVAGGANVPIGLISLVLVALLVGGGGFGLYRFTRPGSLTESGREALELGNAGEAIKAFQEALTYDPDYAPAVIGLVRAAEQARNSALLQRHLDRAIKLCEDPLQRADMRVVYAEQLLALGRHRDAYNQCVDAQDEDPAVKGADALLGLASVELGETQEAITYLQKALKAEPQSERVAYALATLLAEADRAQEAVGPAQVAAEGAPDDPERWLLLADLRDRLKQRGPARQALKKVIELDPKRSLAHSLLAQLYLLDGNTDGALKSASAARDLSPEDPQASLAVAQVLFAQGKFPDAINELGRMFRLKEKLTEAREAEARLLQRKALLKVGKGKTEVLQPVLEALETLGERDNYLELAQIALDHDAYPVAEEVLGRAVAKYERDYEARVLLAKTFLLQESARERLSAKIRTQLDAAMEIDRSRPEAHLLLGNFYLDEGDREQAVTTYASGLTSAPDAVKLLAAHGTLCIELKRWDEALASLERLKKLDPGYDGISNLIKRAEEGRFYDQ